MPLAQCCPRARGAGDSDAEVVSDEEGEEGEVLATLCIAIGRGWGELGVGVGEREGGGA